MRHDHIIQFNEQMDMARLQADETLTVLRHQQQQLENLVSVANEAMQVIGSQIDQIDRLRHVVGQMGASDGPPSSADSQNKLGVALRAVNARENTNGSSK